MTSASARRLLCLAAGATLVLGLMLPALPAVAATGERGDGRQDDASRSKSSAGATEAGRTYDRFIAHFSEDAAAARDDAAARERIREVGAEAGHGLSFTRRLSTGGALIAVDASLDKDKADRLIARFAQKADVDFIEPDVSMTPALTPDDPSYGLQWHYAEPLAGMNLSTAWDTADGSGVHVAVLDTGITAHPDLDGNVVGGYDFVSSATNARDGNGRDANPADQGDWSALGECGLGLGGSNSSWHGTHVAGTVAALTGNATGVSGVAFRAKVVPVRVLAKCGGTLADIADAITWASGGTVTGVPSNPHPAKVINMSLGGSGTCGATYQNAINAAVARGTTVVVAAGNSNANAANYQPSSCGNTVVVAASDRQGNRAAYSNYGSIIDVTAPGGETNVSADGVLSTLNNGSTVPAAPSYAYYQGTSMATPHVAGLAALVLGERAHSPAQLETALKNGTRALPGSCSGGCGAGLVDAAKAIAAVSAAPASPSPSPTASSSPTPTASPSPTASASPAPPTTFTNSANYTISDRATVESPITVSGRSGSAPANLTVPVDIKHTYRGDLQLDLVAPDGSLYRLKSVSSSDSADNVLATYTVNASTEVANGTWKLRVYDAYSGDTGFIDSWSLTF